MENKHTYMVRETSKFLAGLVAADILVGLWVWSGGVAANQSFFGISITTPIINAWLVVDVFLLLFFIFYGWHITLPVSGSRRALLIAVGVIFTAVSALHFLRLIFLINVIVGNLTVPMWLSIIGSIIPGFLAYASFHLAMKK